MTRLPGVAYQGDDPDGFLPRDAIVTYLDQYAASFHGIVQGFVQKWAISWIGLILKRLASQSLFQEDETS
jgi:hypothetical protein